MSSPRSRKPLWQTGIREKTCRIREVRVTSAEPADLQACISQMRSAGCIAAGARILQAAGRVIGLPVVAVIHDISLPHGPSDETGVKLSDIFGWPEAYKAHWETRGNTFHDPV